jgi:hypothetical protein
MNDLSTETRGLLASLAPSHDPPPDVAQRVHARVAERIAAAPPATPAAAWKLWAGVGVTVLALGWWATRPPSAVAPPPPRPVPAVVAPAAPLAPPVELAPPVVVAPLVVAAPPSVPVPAAVAAPRVERDDLPAELRWIERAQTALAAGDPGAAQAALRGHARAFPRGHLTEEREALSVQALCASGRAEEARRAAAAFVARHPTSPQSARVRRTCVDAP